MTNCYPKHFARFILTGTIAGLVFSSCSDKKPAAAGPANGPKPTPRVEAYIVTKGVYAESLEIPGTLVANESTNINPEIAGRLVSLNIPEGKTVSQGTLIGKLYDGDLQAQLQKLSVQLSVQEQTIQRYEQLLKISGVSQQEYDLVVLQRNNIKADMDVVRSNIRRTEIRAPFTGKMGLKMISPGAYVSPATVLTTMQQQSGLKLDFTLPEKYSSMIHTGMPVQFQAKGGNQSYTANVIATESGIAEANRSLRIRCAVSGNHPELIPGSFAEINLEFAPDTNAILIPSQAVIPQARGKKAALLKAGEVVMQDIVTAARDSARVQITSGLQPGDTIILTGLMALRPGSKVIVQKIVNQQANNH